MMPDNNHRRDSEFSKYDAMSIEELQQILREDASKPVGEESDSQALFYIMEVLAKRRKERNEEKNAAEALESFKNKYYTENESPSISESVPVARKRSISGLLKRGLAAAVAAICILVVVNSITASALGFDLFAIVAKWTQETFHFGYAGQVDESRAPQADDATPLAGLHEAIEQLDIQVSLVPTWMPQGYTESEVRIVESPLQRIVSAKYDSGENSIRIRITDYLDAYPAQVEQSDVLIEIYTRNGIDYYLFDNYEQLKAVWITDNFECSIGGSLSISEIKEMIDSIGKG